MAGCPIKKVIAVFFSPTGSTGKIAKLIARTAAEELGAEYGTLDFTLPEARKAETLHKFTEEDLLVFGMPTYAGRLPNKISPFVGSGFMGDGTPLIAVVTYGNRSAGSSLAELRYLLERNGFRSFGEASFPCRHAFTDALAPGRPDEKDLEEAADFARRAASGIAGARERGEAAGPLPAVTEEEIGPYYTPKREDGGKAVFLKARPSVDPSGCDNCGTCAGLCPMGSIDPANCLETPGICIKCCACIRGCPRGARTFTDPDFLSHVRMLERDFKERKEIYVSPA